MTQADWSPFFTAQVGASAALIGLLFVSLSINLDRIIKQPYLVDRVGEAILVFLLPFLFSTFGLVPHLSIEAFGALTLSAGLAIEVLTTTLQMRRFGARPPEARLSSILPWLAIMQTATLSTIVAGISLSLGHANGFDWLISATVVSYIGGVTSAWVLTIEILR